VPDDDGRLLAAEQFAPHYGNVIVKPRSACPRGPARLPAAWQDWRGVEDVDRRLELVPGPAPSVHDHAEAGERRGSGRVKRFVTRRLKCAVRRPSRVDPSISETKNGPFRQEAALRDSLPSRARKRNGRNA
jgi:hypothetical protein